MKLFYSLLCSTLLLMLSILPVFAKSQKNTIISLIEVRNDNGGGVIFVFQVNGMVYPATG